MKKLFIRLLLFLAAILLLLLIIGFVFFKNQAPDYNEELQIEGLNQEVNIYYDQFAIPHIYANDKEDAFLALGYVHAKDRLWQMEVLRRIAPGRLSELFGAATLDTDRFFRTIGLGGQSKIEAARYQERVPVEVRQVVDAYLNGINKYIERDILTMEHRLLSVNLTPFTIEDVYNVIGYMSFSFSVSHKTEPIVDYIGRNFGTEYLDALDMHVAPGSTTINSSPWEDYSDISLHIDRILDELPFPELIGSNSWVIGPDKTSDGQVILANDPHIGFSQPSVWYEAHMETPGFSLYGYHIAGFPLAQIGHTDHHAVGLTMFENDDLDYFRERMSEDGTQHWIKDHWEEVKFRKEVIQIKDSTQFEFEVRETSHGPIISDVVDNLDPADPVSMWWVYQKHPLRLLEASYRIMHSTDIEGARLGASMIHAPGLNVMYGDKEGNIAWWAAAKLPVRPEHVNSKTILNGANGEDEILGYLNFSQNPQAINPPEGYVYSANNQSVGINGMRHPGYYLPEDRARRITSLLKNKDDWNTGDVRKMILDVTSLNVPEIKNVIQQVSHQLSLSETEQSMMAELNDWKGNYELNENGPTIYVKLIYHLMKRMTEDELGERWKTFNGTHLMKRSIQPLISNMNAPWWDDVSSSEKESRNDIVLAAIQQTSRELLAQFGPDMASWTWDKVHTLEHPHAFGTNPSLRKYFNVGPFPVPGSTEVINNFQFVTSADGTYEVAAGPSTRRVVNLNDLKNDSWSILPTGQSGNVFSPHYSDQAEMYVRGAFRPQLMDKDAILKNQLYHTVLTPE